MRYLTVVGIILSLAISGCSSISIIPKPATPGATVNSSDQSIKINNSGLIISSRVQDTAVGGYEIETPIAALYLTLNNRSNTSIDVSLDAFSLVDSGGTIHKPIPPEEVNAILNPAISSFMPYPFVGYYDFVDLEQYKASSAMASERPYIGSGLPAIEQLSPLVMGSLGKNKTRSGMLYFNIEIIDEVQIELKAELPVAKSDKKLSYSFPYSIEK